MPALGRQRRRGIHQPAEPGRSVAFLRPPAAVPRPRPWRTSVVGVRGTGTSHAVNHALPQSPKSPSLMVQSPTESLWARKEFITRDHSLRQPPQDRSGPRYDPSRHPTAPQCRHHAEARRDTARVQDVRVVRLEDRNHREMGSHHRSRRRLVTHGKMSPHLRPAHARSVAPKRVGRWQRARRTRIVPGRAGLVVGGAGLEPATKGL